MEAGFDGFKQEMKDTLGHIKARRRAYERFLPMLGAFSLATIYSYITFGYLC